MAERPLIINHVEMVYPPGGRAAAHAFYELLGFDVAEYGPWLIVRVDPETGNGIDNALYSNELIPAQKNFEAALEHALETDSELAATLERYRTVRQAHPQFSFHFGVSIPTHEEWEERLERVQEAGRSHPLLAGRVEVTVFEPGHPDSVGPQSQAFIQTDVLACGPLGLGLVIELQWTHIPESGEFEAEALQTHKFPDFTAMV